MPTNMVNTSCALSDSSKSLETPPRPICTAKEVETTCAMNDLSHGSKTSTAPQDLPGYIGEGVCNLTIASNAHFSNQRRKEPVESDDRGEDSFTDNTTMPDNSSCAAGIAMNIRDSSDKVVCKGRVPSEGQEPYSPDGNSIPLLESAFSGHQEQNLPHAERAGEHINVDDHQALGTLEVIEDDDASLPYEPPDPLSNFSKFLHLKASILSISARRFLSIHLNQIIEGLSENGYAKDWKGLAECMNMDVQYTYSLDRLVDPTDELLKQWTSSKDNTIGRLLEHLLFMERYDIIEDSKFFQMVCKSVEAEKDRQAKDKKELAEEKARKSRNSPGKEMYTTADAEAGGIVHYDAFVCFEDDDVSFVMEMLTELEEKRGLKLCVSARDLLCGQNEQVVTAELVKSRCRKTLVVLSPAFLRLSEESAMGQFAMRIAQSLNPAGRSRVIPLINESCTIPLTLNHLTPVDFSHAENRRWLWGKVAKSLESDSLLMPHGKADVRGDLRNEDDALSKITLTLRPQTFDIRASMREKEHSVSGVGDSKSMKSESCGITTKGTVTAEQARKKVGISLKSSSSSKKKKKKDEVTEDTSTSMESTSSEKSKKKKEAIKMWFTLKKSKV